MVVEMKKEILRREIKERRDNISLKLRKEKSKKIKEFLFSTDEFKKAKTVMFYITYGSEVMTEDMIEGSLERGKKVALPKCLKDEKKIIPLEIKNISRDLERGAFGIREPKRGTKIIQTQEINLVIVPGVAFDRKGTRLGYGGGFYDKFLKNLPDSSRFIGLAFQEQVVKSIPRAARDIMLHKIITDQGVMEFAFS